MRGGRATHRYANGDVYAGECKEDHPTGQFHFVWRFLFEPNLYPKSTFVKKFGEVFGHNRKLQNVCVFAFEPNPYHKKSQMATQTAYQRMGWRYHYMPFGVSDSDGELTF